MTKASVLLDQRLDISERFRVELKVLSFEKSERFPDGVKVNFVLIDVFEKTPRLLIDNHAPYGFHVHEELPHLKHVRRELDVRDYFDALDVFWVMVKEILNNED